MMRKTLLMTFVVALGLVAAEPPKAEALMDGYIEATGGLEAYRSLKTQKVVAEIEFVGQGIKGTSTTLLADNGNSITTLDLAGIGKVLSGTKDGVSWESSAMQGTRLREGEEKIQNMRLSDLRAAANWREYTEMAEVTGEESVEGKDCWVVKSRMKGVNNDSLSWIDKKSGLMVKMSMKVKSQMGEIPMETFFREYRKEGGILMPVAMEQKVGPMMMKTTVKEVVSNGEVPANAFDYPEAVSALLAKKK
ncbi:MAG: hypothetical protein NW208_12780 [Bryobacter sp.]|nr:hypothetical protein [Bryobacter sp.]